MTIRLSTIAGGGAIKLAPDLNYISEVISFGGSSATPYRQTGDINGTAGLATALSLTGKFALSGLSITLNINEVYRIKLTIDGEVKWDSSNTLDINANILGNIAPSSTVNAAYFPIQCQSSILLETESTTDTAYRFNYDARPIV